MKYRKKPIVVDAIQWTGHNTKEAMEFVGTDNIIAYTTYFEIKRIEGNLKVSEMDWIVKGVKGEFYPCKPDIFKETYEKVEDKELKFNEDQYMKGVTKEDVKKVENILLNLNIGLSKKQVIQTEVLVRDLLKECD